MSPEELQKVRKSIAWIKETDPCFAESFGDRKICLMAVSELLDYIESLQADLTKSELVIRAKMTCIDEQAKEIEKANQRATCWKDIAENRAKIIKQQTKILNERDKDIDSFIEQIKKLQAALIKERFWKIWRGGKHTDVTAATELAKKQLRAEMPGEMT